MAQRKKTLPKAKLSARIKIKKNIVSKKPTIQAARIPLPASSADSSSAAWLLLAAVFLTLLGVLGLPTMSHLVEPVHFPWGRGGGFPLVLGMGFVLLFWAFRVLPVPEGVVDLSRGKAYGWLLFLFLVCFAIRFFNPEVPSQSLNDDGLGIGDDLRKIVDFHFGRMFTAVGIKNAIFNVFCAPLEILFPQASPFWVVRLGGTLADMANLWGLYLLGRVLEGRRLGLILASLLAACKFSIVFVYFEYGWGIHMLVCTWALVFFFRLLQKPVFSRYIYFGIALAFGGYSWYTFRPWLPALMGALLLWILFNFREKPRGIASWFLMSVGMAAWVFLFFYKNHFIPANHPLTAFWVEPSHANILYACLFLAYVKTGIDARAHEACFRVFGWATSMFLAWILMLPALMDSEYSSHLAIVSAMSESTKTLLLGGGGILHNFWLNFVYFLELLFAFPPSQGPLWYPMAGDSALDPWLTLAMVAGLAFFAARPSWKRVFVLAMVPVGLSPFIFSVVTYLGRSADALLLLLVIGGWGMSYFYQLLRRSVSRPIFLKFLFLLFLIFWCWNASWSFRLGQKWVNTKTVSTVVGEQITKDSGTCRVVVDLKGLGRLPSDLSLFCDPKEVYTFRDSNPLCGFAEEAGKPIVLLTGKDNRQLLDRVTKEFPAATLGIVPGNMGHPEFIARVVIPFESLGENSGALFYRQRMEERVWRRRFYYQWLGLAHGLIAWEERVSALGSVFPDPMVLGMSCRAEGLLDAPIKGVYLIEAPETGNCLELVIDGKKIFRLGSINGYSKGGRAKVALDKGVHRVTYSVYFQNEFKFPDVTITPPGGSPRVLGKELKNG